MTEREQEEVPQGHKLRIREDRGLQTSQKEDFHHHLHRPQDHSRRYREEDLQVSCLNSLPQAPHRQRENHRRRALHHRDYCHLQDLETYFYYLVWHVVTKKLFLRKYLKRGMIFAMEHEHNTPVDTPSAKRVIRVPLKAIFSALTVAVVLTGGYVGYQKIVPQYPPLLPAELRNGRIGAVAEVNNVKISRERYNTALAAVANLATSNGITLSDDAIAVEIKKAALKTVIENEVLLQAARAAQTEVDEEKVNEQILATSIQMGGEDAVKEELKRMGITYNAYRTSVVEQTLLSNYMEKTIPSDTASITDDVVKAFYKERTANVEPGVEIPEFEGIKEQVREYLANTAREEKIRAHIDELIAAAEVKELLTIKEVEVTAPEEEVVEETVSEESEESESNAQ